MSTGTGLLYSDCLQLSTNREEMRATMAETGTDVHESVHQERVIDYNTVLTDAFGQPVSASGSVILDTDGIPKQIDGFQNDDAYRTSRHYGLNKKSTGNATTDAMLRESSLARQVQEKVDQPAIIRLIRRVRQDEVVGRDPTQGNRQLPWANIIPPNTKFFLESVVENREEKVQIVDTFGEWMAFFFGRRPEVYNYSGSLLNTSNHNWKDEFQMNYEYFLRGSKAVENHATMFLQYDDVIVEGYMLNCQMSQHALQDKSVPFTFNMLVLNRSPLNPLNLLSMRMARSGSSSSESELFQSMSAALSLTDAAGKPDPKKLENIETFLLMREYFSGNYIPGAGTAVSQTATGQITGPNAQLAQTIQGGAAQLSTFAASATASQSGADLGRMLGHAASSASGSISSLF